MKTRRISQALALIALGFLSVGSALSCTSNGSGGGNWSLAATWKAATCTARPPGPAEAVQIDRGDTVTMNTTATVASLLVGASAGNGTSTLNFAAGSQLTVNGTVTLSGTSATRNGVTSMTAGGTLIVNSATPFALGAGAVTWTPGTGTVQLSANNTLAFSAGVFDSFNNLTISSNTTTLGGATTVTGNLTVNGVLAGASALALTGAGTTIAGTGSVTSTGTTTITNNKTISAGSTLSFAGPFVVSTGTTTHSGTSLTLSNNLTVNGTIAGTGPISLTGVGATIDGTGSVTDTGTVTITNNKTIAAGSTLSFAGPFVVSTGTTTHSGTSLTLSNNLTVNGAIAGTGPISLTGAGATIAGTGSVTDTGTVTITNNKTIAAGSTLSFAGPFVVSTGTTTHSGTSLTLSNNLTVNGTIAGTGPIGLSGVGATIDGAGSITDTGTVTVTNNKSIASTAALTIASPISVSSGTLTNNGTITSSNTATGIAGGGAWTNAANSTLNIAGPLTVTTFTASANPNTVNYNGSGAQTVVGTTYHNLTINKAGATGTLGAATQVNGTLTLTAGTLADGGFTLTAQGNVANSATHSGAGKILLSGGSAQHQLSGTGTYQNLELNDANGALLTAGPTVNGTLTLTTGTLADGGFTLTAKGNVANSATHSGTGKILLNGTSQQTLSGTGTYGNLELNNASGALLSASPTVSGTLTFTSGSLTTSSNTLTVGASGSIAGAGTSKHVVGNLGKTFSAAGSFTYAVGDGTNYTPATINFTTLTTAGSLVVSSANGAGVLNNGDHPNSTSATDGLDKDHSVNRYWTVKTPAASTIAGAYTALFVYLSGDLDAGTTAASMKIEQGTSCSGSGASRTCSTWIEKTTTSNNCASGSPSSTQACATNPTLPGAGAESDFALGIVLGPSNFAREKQFIYTREQY